MNSMIIINNFQLKTWMKFNSYSNSIKNPLNVKLTLLESLVTNKCCFQYSDGVLNITIITSKLFLPREF